MRLRFPLLFLVACTDLPVDEWSAAEDADAIGNAPPTHPLEDCPGNAPGGPVADPPGGPGPGRPIPEPRDCSKWTDPVECRDCCNWNVDYVWGERCNRMKNKKKKAICWEETEQKRGQCHKACTQIITTATGDLP